MRTFVGLFTLAAAASVYSSSSTSPLPESLAIASSHLTRAHYSESTTTISTHIELETITSPISVSKQTTTVTQISLQSEGGGKYRVVGAWAGEGPFLTRIEGPLARRENFSVAKLASIPIVPELNRASLVVILEETVFTTKISTFLFTNTRYTTLTHTSTHFTTETLEERSNVTITSTRSLEKTETITFTKTHNSTSMIILTVDYGEVSISSSVSFLHNDAPALRRLLAIPRTTESFLASYWPLILLLSTHIILLLDWH